MPADLIPQIATIRRVLEILEIPILEHPQYEADDLLATLSHQVDQAGGECVLVTADKDYRQLITDRVKLYNMRKHEAFDADALMADWGIRPDQVIDYQTLVGDPVDNVPGVPLIGPKIAKDLLTQFDTLDNLFANLDQLKGKRKENLENFRTQLPITRRLVQLEQAAPVEIPCKQVPVLASLQNGPVNCSRNSAFTRSPTKCAVLNCVNNRSNWLLSTTRSHRWTCCAISSLLPSGPNGFRSIPKQPTSIRVGPNSWAFRSAGKLAPLIICRFKHLKHSIILGPKYVRSLHLCLKSTSQKNRPEYQIRLDRVA